MDDVEFGRLFQSTLERAANNAERKFGRSFPRKYLVELNVGDYEGHLVEPSEAAAALFIAPDKFYKIIDVCVKTVQSESTIFFVRPSGHAPVPLSGTFDPHGAGPFKEIEPLTVEDRS
jgi:hypothetical protein